MAQRPKIINTRQSYVPIDPETFVPQSYTNERSDAPDEVAGAVAYDGKNFMPTPYGYRSFFGLDEAWAERLPSKAQELVFFQLDTLENIAIALCEDGIWIKRASLDTWVHAAKDTGGNAVGISVDENLTEDILTSFDPEDLDTWPDVGVVESAEEVDVYFPWTYCIIENNFYAYRASSKQVWKIAAKPEVDKPSQAVYASREIAETIPPDPANLPTGVYLVTCRIGYLAEDSLGALEVRYTEIIDLAQTSITAAGNGFRIQFAELETPPHELEVYYQLDGGPWHKEVLYPPPVDFIDILWTEEGEEVEEYPPKASIIEAGTPTPQYPTFLNMAGQQGIFRAGFQLGFWDSANAVACSSVNDLMDFEPSVETLASVTTYSKVTGRIVTILPEENNFIIYATRSIVRCVNNVSATQQWEPDSITHAAGIAYPKQVAVGTQEGDQYAYTSVGLARIRGGEFEIIFPEVYDVLKAREEEVVYLQMLEGRYLFLSSFDPVFSPLIFEQEILDPSLLLGSGGGCESVRQYAQVVRAKGPTFAGEMALLDYVLSGKPGRYWFNTSYLNEVSFDPDTGISTYELVPIEETGEEDTKTAVLPYPRVQVYLA